MGKSREKISAKYTGTHLVEHFSFVHAIAWILIVLRLSGIMDWVSQWTKKRYILTSFFNFFLFEIKLLIVYRISHNKSYTRRKFTQFMDSNVSLNILGRKSFTLSLNGFIGIPFRSFIESVSSNGIQEVVSCNDDMYGEHFLSNKELVIKNHFWNGDEIVEYYRLSKFQ